MGRPFAAGDRVLLVDAKRRRHLVTLSDGGQFHSHAGVLDHDALLGQEEGATVRTSLGARLVAVRPTLAEYILKMPRGAQVIYPKDLGPILMLADVFPGAHVLESGVGSGALTTTLLRAVGPHGHVTGYELREEFAEQAVRNIEGFLGPGQPLDLEVRDVYAGIDAVDLDRVLLDLPEPWRAVKHAEAALRPGGILLAYLPTIGQVTRLREELAASPFGMAETVEVLQRAWHVDGQSVRPDHRMVAHTGFLTHARLRAGRVNLLDAVLIVTMGAAGYAGYRLGFVTRALSWAGLATGVAVAVVLVDDLAEALRDEPERSRLVAALALVFVLGTLGQVTGLAAGSALRNRLPARVSTSRGDRVAGAVTGALGVLIGLWLLIPALTSAPGWTARAARDSEIVRFVDRVAPAPPAASRDLARRVADAQFPDVFDDPFSGPEDVGPAPTGGLAPEVSARVESSVVKVEGEACDQIQNGSGTEAADDTVVTNAHVVAGERHTAVETDDGRRLDATVVAFDPDRDLAVLRVRNLDLAPLERGTAGEGDTGAVYGHPGGGELRAAPARVAEAVTARGTDIYRSGRIDRSVFVLASGLAPGDSGGPLVDQRGRVVGVAFAIDPGHSGTAYTLTRKELDPVLASPAASRVDTGPCIVG